MRRETSPSENNVIYGNVYNITSIHESGDINNISIHNQKVKENNSPKRKIGFYKKVIVFATAIVALTTAILILINTYNPRSNDLSSGSKNVISPVIVNDIKIYSPESQPASPEIARVTPPLPPPKPEYRKIFVPEIYGDSSSESAFGGNVRIDLMRIDEKIQARGRITVYGYETQNFILDRHSLPVEIGNYSIKAVDTGDDYAEFRITRRE